MTVHTSSGPGDHVPHIFCTVLTGTYFREIVETESLLELSEEFRLHPGFAMKVTWIWLPYLWWWWCGSGISQVKIYKIFVNRTYEKTAALFSKSFLTFSRKTVLLCTRTWMKLMNGDVRKFFYGKCKNIMSKRPDRVIIRPGLNVPDQIRSGSNRYRYYGCSILKKFTDYETRFIVCSPQLTSVPYRLLKLCLMWQGWGGHHRRMQNVGSR
jgi:hypothetical protein